MSEFDGVGGAGAIPAQSGNARGVWVRGARRTFGAFAAVEHADLVAPPGAVTALVGPAGAAKTTLLLMLATLLTPEGGELRVAGHDPVRAPGQVRARMGWMPDSFGPFEQLTAREVLDLVASACRLARVDRAARTAEVLVRAGLRDYADRPVSVLTRGQKQRLGLARAIVHRPAVLLADDPTADLDAANRGELARLLRELAVEGTAVLITARPDAELSSLADRVVRMAAGRTASADEVAPAAPPTVAPASAPWRIRALDTAALLAALDAYGVHPYAAAAAGVQVMLAGDDEAADLVGALVRDGVRVVALGPVPAVTGVSSPPRAAADRFRSTCPS